MTQNKDISDRWFKVWEEDDGFNIKAGARQDMIDIFFMEEKEDEEGEESTGEKEPGAEKAEQK